MLVLASYDCGEFHYAGIDLRGLLVGAYTNHFDYSGAFCQHYILPLSHYGWVGACRIPYDCDWSWNANDFIALAAYAGDVRSYDGCGVFYLHINTQVTYYAWEVGACLMIVIGSIVNQL